MENLSDKQFYEISNYIRNLYSEENHNEENNELLFDSIINIINQEFNSIIANVLYMVLSNYKPSEIDEKDYGILVIDMLNKIKSSKKENFK